MAKFHAPRGTEDILPQEIQFYRRIEELSRSVFSCFNFKEIRTPLFEETGLFARGLGEHTDIIEKQLFLVKQRDEQESRYCLRPEGTSSVLRAYLEHNLTRGAENKLFYIGSMFRGERPQKGRLRQFSHIGAELIGSYDFRADAEMIILAEAIFKKLDLKGYSLLLNTLGCKEDKKKFSSVLKKKLRGKLDSLCGICKERFDRNILRVLDCKNSSCKKVLKELDFDRKEYMCQDCISHFQGLKEVLSQKGIPFLEEPFLVRGLDYYTRTVFEFVDSSLGAQNAFAAGGRYDGLFEELGGQPQGCVGFAIGQERMAMLLKKEKFSGSSSVDVFVVVQDKNLYNKAFEILCSLREIDICSDMDYRAGSFKSQMRRADALGSRYCIIFGENEDSKNGATLKDMKNGQQEFVDYGSLNKIIKEKL